MSDAAELRQTFRDGFYGEEPNLARTLGSVTRLALLAAGTAIAAKRFLEDPSRKSSLLPVVMLGMGTVTTAVETAKQAQELADIDSAVPPEVLA